jgi:putative hydrolase of the HAD superfamily
MRRISIRVVMFDIGGILEVIPEEGDPATRFPALDVEWESRLGLPPGYLTRCFEAIAEDGAFGRCTYAEWCARLRQSMGMSQADFDAYIAACWDIYMGGPNEELIAYSYFRSPARIAIGSRFSFGARGHVQRASYAHDGL